ncbi:YajG family lipoprotein [Desulfococcus sp.]|uniref:YajG family lipoprotein n=1 Tax=Desulfococcus sp. TaxID=2025834 RepID=UPI003593517D
MKSRILLCGLVAALLTSCAGNMIVRPDYHPPLRADAPLAAVPKLKVRLLDFADRREPPMDASRVGRRETSGVMPMVDVFSERPVSDIVRDAVWTELVRNGHRIVTSDEDVTMQGDIHGFWVGTETTGPAWDVSGEVSIAFRVTYPAAGSPTVIRSYTGKNVERTYLTPGKEIMARPLVKSLADVMTSMSSDRELMAALKAGR